MKGLTHFMSGAAVASFFLPAVKMAGAERIGGASSFILCLGGLFGIMPDTMDFKMGQFFTKAEYEIDPDPMDPDPQEMAEGLGKALDQAYDTNQMVKAQMYPMRLGADLWRQYVVNFDGEKNEVVIIINEVVTTSQVPVLGSEPPPEKRIGRYKIKGEFNITHGRPSVVDIMSGPMYGFSKNEDGKMEIEFLPWHRTWSHSYVLGLFLSIPIWLIASLIAGWNIGWLYGLIAFLGFSVHLTEDLTGHMGGSLLWPFIKPRCNGLNLFRASNPHANFCIDYTAVVLILFNLNRFAPQPAFTLSPFKYFLYCLILPMIGYFAIVKIFGEKKKQKKGGIISMEKALAREEMEYEAEESMAGDM